MDIFPTALLVHAAETAWGDLIGELQAAQLPVQPVTSLVEAELRIRNQRPDIVLLDGCFENGVDLLLQARQTAAGTVVITVRKLRGGEGFYAATLPGGAPLNIEPTSARQLARRLKEHLLPLRPGAGRAGPPQRP